MEVRRILPSEIAESAHLYVGGDPETARTEFLRLSHEHKWNPMCQVVARDGALRGILLYFPLADGSWLCDQPRLGAKADPALLAALLTGVRDAARGAGVGLVRYHAEGGAGDLETPLKRADWSCPASLVRLHRTASIPLPPSPPSLLSWEERPPARPGDLIEIVRATQEGSSDVPELEPRSYTTLDFFLPHSPRGDARWAVAIRASVPIGCLLVNLHHDDPHAEIRYMGIVPSARGRGLGLHLVRRAVEIAREAGVPEVRLAVDRRNVAALKTYQAAGFREYGGFDLWIARQ
ncbi:MAG: GNAT family N-acetyltransferase [Planctomycetes bacterium]|nr:GNAT family N-acetyltransferase [Planctomycetota bacterium]